MSIFDHTKRQVEKEATRNEEAMKEALALYSTQKESFTAFKNSQAMRTIKRFFEAEKDLCERVFRDGTKPEYASYMQGKYSLVRKFLDMLSSFDL